mgnify:CR=1 FL=1
MSCDGIPFPLDLASYLSLLLCFRFCLILFPKDKFLICGKIFLRKRILLDGIMITIGKEQWARKKKYP